MMYPKKKRIKSEKYLAWVRTLECCVCRKPAPSIAHHIKGFGNFSGTGIKASDYLSMPMCATCHSFCHAAGGDIEQFDYIVETIDRAFQEGVIKL